MTHLSKKFSGFLASQDGAMAIGGLVFIVFILAVGGLAVDVSNAVNQRAQLQVTADATAHDALYTRNKDLTKTADEAKAEALALGDFNMPSAAYGPVLTASDIEFGVWDRTTRHFTPDPTSRSAVRVKTHRDEAGGNEVATHLLKLAGFESWDIRTDSVFETYVPDCLREGFVAEHMVDIQSNNAYLNGFCIHSNDIVSINSNNYFEEGHHRVDAGSVAAGHSGLWSAVERRFGCGAALWCNPDPADQCPARGAVFALRDRQGGDVELYPAGGAGWAVELCHRQAARDHHRQRQAGAVECRC